MRHAIGILGLIGVTITAASVFCWSWLSSNGASSNSQVIQHIALGVAAVLTLLFVIWRERIAGANASFEQYRTGVRMLGDTNMVTRIAGIQLLEEVGQYPRWSPLALQVLNAFVSNSTSDDDPDAPAPEGDDVKSAKDAIQKLDDKV